jgi:hypothetical protein
LGEVIWLTKGPMINFPSCKTLTKEVWPYIMRHTFQKFVLPYVNAIVFVTITFDI